ncbi:MAG TPA: hypothetical protein VNU20_00525 [Candidatus Sulfotelmatobacter sp.]|jgi:hypothetical protein|nr:hypothetical protein [Candidatus Sulfotelmatobacter sp.]
MQTVYYSLMKKLLAVVVVVFLGIVAGRAAVAQQNKPLRTSILDAHEGVTIGVEPWTQASRYKEKFPKKNPFAAGIVALRLSIRNDNDEAVKLNLHRIQLLVQLDADNKQELEALTADDVADAVMLRQNGKDPTARRLPIPLPISRPKPTRDKNWEEFHGDCQNAGIPSGVIGAHSTMEGLVYFDLRGEWDLLQTARLYVPDLQRMTSQQAISYFDIDFSRGPEN